MSLTVVYDILNLGYTMIFFGVYGFVLIRGIQFCEFLGAPAPTFCKPPDLGTAEVTHCLSMARWHTPRDSRRDIIIARLGKSLRSLSSPFHFFVVKTFLLAWIRTNDRRNRRQSPLTDAATNSATKALCYVCNLMESIYFWRWIWNVLDMCM